MMSFSWNHRSKTGYRPIGAWDGGPNRALGSDTSLGESIIARIKIFAILVARNISIIHTFRKHEAANLLNFGEDILMRR